MKSQSDGVNWCRVMSQDLIEEFLIFLEVEKNYSPATIREYRYDLNLLANFYQDKTLEQLKPAHIRKFLLYLKKDRESQPRTLHRKICSLRSFYRFLTKEGYIDQNPMESIETPRVPKSLPKIISVEEVQAMFQAAESTRDLLILMLLYSSGLRVSELCNLNINNVDFQEGLIRVIHGKGGKDRVVPISHKVLELLKRFILEERGEALNSSAPLFVSRSSTRLSTRSIQRIVSKCRKRAGIERKVTPHTLRHAFATHLIENKVDIRYIQEYLGHSSLATTQIYTHVSLRHLKQAYDEAHPIQTMDLPLE